jgi:SAM-dependent methyltransferase
MRGARRLLQPAGSVRSPRGRCRSDSRPVTRVEDRRRRGPGRIGWKLAWFSTGHRRRLTLSLRPVIISLRGVALDVGGDPEAPHDRWWPGAVRRIRVDVSPRDLPDVVADARALPASDGSVDTVVMCEVLEHLPEPAGAIEEARRVLRPGGLLCGSVPFAAPLHGSGGDYFRYTAEGLRYLLRGFARSAVRPDGSRFGAAWQLLSYRSLLLPSFNPVMRALGTGADPPLTRRLHLHGQE